MPVQTLRLHLLDERRCIVTFFLSQSKVKKSIFVFCVKLLIFLWLIKRRFAPVAVFHLFPNGGYQQSVPTISEWWIPTIGTYYPRVSEQYARLHRRYWQSIRFDVNVLAWLRAQAKDYHRTIKAILSKDKVSQSEK